jgi:uncharacterized membrane protein YkvA (DUF1232 family)
MRIALDLSQKDLRYFRDALKKVRQEGRTADESAVIWAATELRDAALASEPPDFVRSRIVKLDLLVQMLEDEDWRLKGPDRTRILNVLAYYAEPDDIIPDRVPGLGFLDDAIMLELVVQDLKHEIEAYENFCEFRRERKPSAESLLKRRDSLQARMRRRRRAQHEALRSRRPGRSPLRLW